MSDVLELHSRPPRVTFAGTPMFERHAELFVRFDVAARAMLDVAIPDVIDLLRYQSDYYQRNECDEPAAPGEDATECRVRDLQRAAAMLSRVLEILNAGGEP